jgi:hypothetical protein
MFLPAPVNDVLKEYCTSAKVADWNLRESARELHEWAGRFNDHFGLELATPVIVLERLRARAAAYHAGRNGLGLLHEVRVNSKELDQPLAARLVELLRELLKERESLDGQPSQGRYCSAALRARAQGYGLCFDRYGRWQRVEPGPFTELLARQGVDCSVLLQPPATGPREDAGPMKKWQCGCTIIRCATELRAVCLACGATFQRAEPGRGRRAGRLV